MRITDKSLVEQQKISESELKHRLHLFRLTPSDLDEVRTIKSIISRQLDVIVDEFYQHQTRTPDVENLIGDAGTLKRLMSALRQYIIDLFTKEINLDYVEHRLRIGLVHKRIGVDPKLYISAVNYLKSRLIATINNNIQDPDYARFLSDIIDRLIDFDVSYVFDTYIKSMMNEIEIERNKSYQYVNDLESMVQERTKKLEKMTRLDPLTNLYNKRAFDEFTNKLFTEAQKNNLPISIVYIDVDKFKSFNDQHGHEEGDAVLVIVSDCIRSVSRSVDLCFRVGGDEFVVVMPSCAKSDANKNYIPRLLENLASIRTDLSLSIGVAQSGPKNYLSCQDTLARADKDMYINKAKNVQSTSDKRLKCVSGKEQNSA
ncbi:GGDEF domain-containing protein [Vibrio coralliilyticus]|uniref:GGDEF domain-containing protein n=1 Tax=Vibrio coralliilyticus TaxID=190893 RepID=UPI001E605377|nr:GGDEF domain-containing protein [Vibrio coralliilyticus]MCC2520801.1 GGDEF domain-containing protein [Vibrio coralliilyticus]